jgi:hypothetical protein
MSIAIRTQNLIAKKGIRRNTWLDHQSYGRSGHSAVSHLPFRTPNTKAWYITQRRRQSRSALDCSPLSSTKQLFHPFAHV